MNRHLFELYYQEEFIKDKSNYYQQPPHKYPMYSLEGRLKWNLKKNRYDNPETQKAWEWWCTGYNVGRDTK